MRVLRMERVLERIVRVGVGGRDSGGMLCCIEFSMLVGVSGTGVKCDRDCFGWCRSSILVS